MVEQKNQTKEKVQTDAELKTVADAQERADKMIKDSIPAPFTDDKKIKTTVVDFSKVVENTLSQLKDLATMEILLPGENRMRHRLQSIKEMSSAKHIKVRGLWKTTSPKMHITKLEGRRISNGHFEVSFSVYQMEKGEKKIKEHKSERQDPFGNKFEVVTSAEYPIDYDVVETIRDGKLITREITKINA